MPVVGAYTYGKTKYERYVDEHGAVKKRIRHLPMDRWAVLIPDHHPGCIDWATFQANQARLDSNTRPQPHQAGGAVREGSALLQGIATCGHCGRRLMTHYRGRNSTPGYHCAGKNIVYGRGQYCLTIGGLAIEQAVVHAFLEAVTPAAVEATMLSVQQLQAKQDAALSQWRLEVERARYEAERAERRYRTVEPENRLVARGLETEWENRLRDGRSRNGTAPPGAKTTQLACTRTAPSFDASATVSKLKSLGVAAIVREKNAVSFGDPDGIRVQIGG